VHHRVFPLLEDSENAAGGLVCLCSFVEVSIVTECISFQRHGGKPRLWSSDSKRITKRKQRHVRECKNGSSDPYNRVVARNASDNKNLLKCSLSTDLTCPCMPGTRNSVQGRWQGL